MALPVRDEDGKLLTVKEAAFEAGVHVETIRRWISEGMIDSVRIYPTNRVRVPASEVRRILTPRPIA
jgi:excisionase family DNA binding protein